MGMTIANKIKMIRFWHIQKNDHYVLAKQTY